MTAPLIRLVDDDDAVRQAWANLLAAHGYCCETYAEGADLLDRLDPCCPGCIITDVYMPGMDGVTLHAELRHRAPLLPVIMVSGHADIATAVRSIKAGASDFLEKPVEGWQLLGAIDEALARSGRSFGDEAARGRLAILSRREREVLDRLVLGASNKTIARELGISPRTAEIHRAHLMSKLECRSVAELVRLVLTLEVAAH